MQYDSCPSRKRKQQGCAEGRPLKSEGGGTAHLWQRPQEPPGTRGSQHSSGPVGCTAGPCPERARSAQSLEPAPLPWGPPAPPHGSHHAAGVAQRVPWRLTAGSSLNGRRHRVEEDRLAGPCPPRTEGTRLGCTGRRPEPCAPPPKPACAAACGTGRVCPKRAQTQATRAGGPRRCLQAGASAWWPHGGPRWLLGPATSLEQGASGGRAAHHLHSGASPRQACGL